MSAKTEAAFAKNMRGFTSAVGGNLFVAGGVATYFSGPSNLGTYLGVACVVFLIGSVVSLIATGVFHFIYVAYLYDTKDQK